MNDLRKYWFSVFAAIVFVFGSISAVRGLLMFRGKMQRMTQASSLLDRMLQLENKAGMVDRSRKVLEGMSRKTPEDPGVLIERSGLAGKLGDTRDAVERVDERWSVLTRELTFNDVLLADVEKFLVECRQARPPWVVVRISVKASPFESGRGQVMLTMQALRRIQD